MYIISIIIIMCVTVAFPVFCAYVGELDDVCVCYSSCFSFL